MAMTGAPVPRHPSRPLPPHPGAQAAPAQRPDRAGAGPHSYVMQAVEIWVIRINRSLSAGHP